MNYTVVIKGIKKSIPFILVFDGNNKVLGTGSGFIFGKKDIVVTCNHVVKDGTSILVKFSDSTEFLGGKVVLRDEEHDLALIKIDQSSREPLPLGDLSQVEEGMPVVFSGYPSVSQDLTTHQGIISGIVKDATGLTSYLIDGTVNSGNSGCPLMNESGKVIGVVNAKRAMRVDLLQKIEKMQIGAVSLHGVDLVEIYQAITNNLQLGVGVAIPASYIPEHKEESKQGDKPEIKMENKK